MPATAMAFLSIRWQTYVTVEHTLQQIGHTPGMQFNDVRRLNGGCYKFKRYQCAGPT